MLTDIEIFTPGRLLIVGDHSDWAGGYGKQPTHAVLTGINQGIYAIANKSDYF